MSRYARLSLLVVLGVAAPALAAIPTTTTRATTSITGTTATFNGTINPNGEDTLGYFRYGTTDPGSCNDTFGSRLPSSGGTGVGNGTVDQDFNIAAIGLLPGRTYYFCAIGSNASGKSYGAVMSFNTPAQPPTVTTISATNVTSSTAVLEGEVNANGADTTVWFRYSTSSPGSVCNNTFGTRVPLTGGTVVTGNSTTPYTENISGLTAGVTYYYCAVAQSSAGLRFGSVLSFTTLVAAPTVTTNTAASVGGYSATLRGTAVPNGAATTAWFRYADSNPGGCNDAFGTRYPSSSGALLGVGSSGVYQYNVTGLNPGTTYYYCAIAQNSVGISYGNVETFTTPNVPTVLTNAQTNLTATTATLNGAANPNGSATTAYFNYSTTNPGVCSDGFGTYTGTTSIAAGNSSVPYSANIASLLPGTTYYYCAIAYNGVGTGLGPLSSFTTPPTAPIMNTQAATTLTGTSATLNGTVNPRGAATTVYFRYGTTDPGTTCSDSYGARLPATGGQVFAASNSTSNFNEPLTGLTPGTTYYYCAIGTNSAGATSATRSSFTTPNVPTVTTSLPYVYSDGVSAYFYGTVTANGAGGTAWFRYATTSPGTTCSDTWGTRWPATGGTSFPASAVAYSFDDPISTLTPGTTYYVCAFAANIVGTGAGSPQTFTTPNTPVVTTTAATSISSPPTTSSTATLNATVDPRGAATVLYWRYGTTDPGATCSDTFGTATTTTSIAATASSASYSRAVSLLPGVTYYFCAVAYNDVNYPTRYFGAVLSFTTPATAPYPVTTGGASAVTGTTATLGGTANPRGAATTAYFRYGTTSTTSCSDSYGTRLPATGGTSMSTNLNTNTSFTEALTGLSPGTTYYYCAAATNSVGTTFGSVSTFSTPNIPTVTTNAPVVYNTGTTAQFYGYANPNGANTNAWFRYSTVDPGTCNDTFGAKWPLGTQTYPLSTTAQTFGSDWYSPYQVTGLTPGTTYYYCAIASNLVGTGFGTIRSFTTPNVPTVVTKDINATTITPTSALLEGTASPNGVNATAYFRWSYTNPVTCDDSFGFRSPTTGGTQITSANQNFSVTPSNFLPGNTIYYCAVAYNTVGYGFGEVKTLTTPPTAPTVSTSTATLVTSSSATLRGAANPNGAATTAWFRYSTTSPGTSCNDSFGTRVPSTGGTAIAAGNTSINFSEAITGLSLATTYYFCAIAENSQGVRFGTVSSFTTSPEQPLVVTQAATNITTSAGQMNASVNPNGAQTTCWIRYYTTDPGTCADSGGTRLPSNGGTLLSAGTTAQPCSYTPTTLDPGTTYWYCAIASNSAGTGFGQVLNFKTTSTAPTVDTLAATAVSGTTATLGSSINPRGEATTAWFRYSTTNPTSCNDTFGAKVPSAGTSIGSSATAQSFTHSLSGLTPGTTYYFCAIGENSVGKTLGALLTFSTPNAPTVNTQPATPVTSTSATLNGNAAGNGNASTAWFRWSTTSPGTCNDTFGTRVPSGAGTGSAITSSTTLQSFSQSISGLSPGTTYYFCAIASNPVGISFGSVFSFVTPAAAPTVTSAAATNIASTTARFHGSANPNGDATDGFFRYSTANPGSCSATFGTRFPASGGAPLGGGTAAVAYFQDVTGLAPNTLYYYCAVATNAAGTGVSATVQSFRTTGAPEVNTSAASLVATTGAQLNGAVDANGDPATAWFRYSTTNPVTCNDTFGTRAPTGTGGTTITGSTLTSFNEAISGLAQGTTYYYCAIAENTVGKAYGSVQSFTTLTAPTVTTNAPTTFASTTATLSGSANPNGQATTAYFRYATVDPGTCNDSFGLRAPTTGGTSIASTAGATSYTQAISGLTPATTYYYCAIASNISGLGFGTVQSFTTLAAPVVTTLAASSVTTTTASLNGSADPKGATTTGYFRYGTTNPGATCASTYGVRWPSTGGTTINVGAAVTNFTEALTGLTAGATYYYCAFATNSVGTSIGSTQIFTTQSAPAVTTLTVSGVTNTTATLNGQANPKSSPTTGWFRYSTTNPVTCNDTFGDRVPATPATDTALGSGGVDVPYDEPITGLSASTTYYYCAIAENALGKAFGAVQSFTTSTPATVTTLAASLIGATSAQVNGSAIPRGTAATGWFRYSATDPGTCNDTFGTRAPTTGGTALGTSTTTATSYAQSLTGLSTATTYYYCAIASNAAGLSFGSVMSFSTQKPPTVTTLAATSVTTTSATFNGQADTHGLSGLGWLRYYTTDPGTCTDAGGTRLPSTSGTTLTASSGPQSYSRTTSLLSPGTTYYYCAFASNSLGTSAGTVQSFTTLVAPTVSSLPATAVAATSATLEGTGNPRGSQTTGYFRYGTLSPGTSCTTTYGSRHPAAGGDDLGNGNSDVAFDEPLTGLQSSTTYYYCAFVTSAAGTAIGTVQSFTTLNAPGVTTAAATNVTGTTATLNGSANPRGDAATGWFRYSATNPVSCDDSFGTRAPAGTGGTSLGNGTTAQPFTENITGLTAGTTYYFCAIAENGVGKSFGSVMSFTTPGAPVVLTNAATGVGGTSATLNGTATPNGAATDGFFRYSSTNPTTCNTTFGTRLPSTGGTALGSGFTAVPFSQTVAGLTPGTTYYYCAYATNLVGTSFGTVQTFTTPTAPVVTTNAATGVSSLGATLNGSVNPGNAASTAWFRYSPSNPGTCNDTFGIRYPSTGGTAISAGSSAVPFSQTLTTLTPGVTYYFCAIASNAVGTAVGTVQSFSTPAQTPLVTTNAVTSLLSTSVTLNGNGTPRGATTTGYFRYSPTNPISCNDTFGSRAPATGGSNLGSGTSPVAFSQNLTGLSSATTYYYCAIVSSAAGTAFGSVLSFRTPGLPVAVTSSASAVTSSSATLNGSATANGDVTTAWFRYSPTSPTTCDDNFGTRVPLTGGVAIGSGTTPVGYSQNISGLLPGRTYFFCAIARNGYGISVGQLLSFTVDAPAPTVATLPVSDITSTGGTLNGQANPNQNETIGWFRYDPVDPGTCNDTFGRRAPATEGLAVGSGSSATPYAASVDGLKANTTYFVCAIASNIGGANFGTPVSFKTAPAKPTVTTIGSSVEPSGIVTLKGLANPNGLDATAWFQYGTTNPGQCHSGFGQRTRLYQIGNGQTESQFTEALNGLTAGTYYFCAIAFTQAGEAQGEVLSFEVGGGGASAGGCGCSSGSGALVLMALAAAAMLRRKSKRA